MKSFFKQVCATVVGLVLSGLFLLVVGVIVIIGVIAVSSTGDSVDEKGLLKLSLNGEVVERATDDALDEVIGKEEITLSLDQIKTAVEYAQRHPDLIKGIYIEAGALVASPAELQEIRKILLEYKKNNPKGVVASYGSAYTQGAYYVCSMADKMMLNPCGVVSWQGLSSETMYLKDLLAKVGVRMQVFKVGAYKSAVEPYIQSEMSSANREQISAYVGEIWKGMVEDVAKSRKVSTESLQAMADKNLSFEDANLICKSNLIDALAYTDDVKVQLEKLSGLNEGDLKLYSITDLCEASEGDEKVEDDKIAVYYAYGDVVSSQLESVGEKTTLCSSEMIDDLNELAEDDDVKAVVLRINSGGGSSYASEQIWHAVMQLKKKKKVVVSMGGLAASGAYYIASAADVIVAEPSTLTGSIGIFGMFPDASDLLTNKLGLHFSEVTTNEHSNLGTMSRPLNDYEMGLLQANVERGYKLFVKRVAQGRHLTEARVNEIAQGRVWTGQQAKALGLVDVLSTNGSLKDAVEIAARQAKLKSDKYEIKKMPEIVPWYEDFINEGKDDYVSDKMKEMLGTNYEAFSVLRSIDKRDKMQARLPFFIRIK